MGRIVVKIDDELERKIRLEIAERGGKKGDLSKTIEEAIDLWIIESEFNESYNKFIRNCRENSLDKERFDQITGSIKDNVSLLLTYISQQKHKKIGGKHEKYQ